MQDPDDAELVRRFRSLAQASVQRAPLYAALCDGVARQPELLRLLHHAPPQQRQPVLLLACIHDLVLRDPTTPLAQWYGSVTDPPRSPHDPLLMATFGAFVADHRSTIVDLLARRRTQTNEVGRCALFLPALAVVARDDGPLAMVDVGASAGLNLLLDRYEYHFRPGGDVGGPSAVVLTTGTRGHVPVPSAVPELAARCGVDLGPLDVTDPEAARWLEACCWPDQSDRFRRLHAALQIATADPPELLAGDATESIGAVVDRLASRGHPVVTTSWVLNYVDPAGRRRFVEQLDRAGERTDLTWVAVESPQQTPDLPWPATARDQPERSHLVLGRWRHGERTVEHLAACHPHGFWLHWRS